jgi:hypothetical protein
MHSSQVDAMNALLIRYIGCSGLAPVADGGYDGLIRFRPETPRLFFGGWRAVCRRVADGATWHSWVRFGSDLDLELQTLVGNPETLRIFLLW